MSPTSDETQAMAASLFC